MIFHAILIFLAICLGVYLGMWWKHTNRVIVYLPVSKKLQDEVMSSLGNPDIPQRFSTGNSREFFHRYYNPVKPEGPKRLPHYCYVDVRQLLHNLSHPIRRPVDPEVVYPFPFVGIVGRPVDNQFTCDWYHDTELTDDDACVLVLSIPKKRLFVVSGTEIEMMDLQTQYTCGHWKQKFYKRKKYPILRNDEDKYYALFTYFYTNDILALHDLVARRCFDEHPEWKKRLNGFS